MSRRIAAHAVGFAAPPGAGAEQLPKKKPARGPAGDFR
jgi:hypothetical protein